MKKKCFKCEETKPLKEFYKHKMMGDGHLNKCKTCTRRDVNENRSAKLEYYRSYDRDRFQNDPERRKNTIESCKKWAANNRERVTELNRNYRARFPQKYKAHCAVNNAIRDGRLAKEKCKICEDSRVEAHHEDYSKPLDVIWLCPKHHKRLHRERGDFINNAKGK